ncbi:MAG TPA: pitrilysin family protein, partial [Hyphomicrobiaceae bacterium]|nr:pitrilysin family protein [Hyphomicrobiaceae bacterium]
IEAWLMELHDAPLLTVRLGFGAGNLHNPGGKFGVAPMTEYMFDEGAGSYDSLELRKRLNSIGANLGASGSSEYLTVSFSTPTAYKDKALELLRLAMHAPRFDAEPIERARTYRMASIDRRMKNPGDIASRPLWRSIFGKQHPMAIEWPDLKAAYARISTDDLKDFRRSFLTRDKLKIAVVGDIDAATLGPLLDRLLGELPAKSTLEPLPPPAGNPGGCHFTPLDVPQAIVQFSAAAPRLSNRQRIAWTLLDAILDQGISTGRLPRELREKRGLVYGVGISYFRYAKFGLVSGNFSAKMSDVPEALAVMRQELRRMVEEGPTEAELAEVKPGIIGGILLGLDTGSALANLMLAAQTNGWPTTHLKDLAGAYEKTTREDLHEVAKLLLNPDRLTVSIVGQPGKASPCETPVAQR